MINGNELDLKNARKKSIIQAYIISIAKFATSVHVNEEDQGNLDEDVAPPLTSFVHDSDVLMKTLSLLVAYIPKLFRRLAKMTVEEVDFDAHVCSQCLGAFRQVLDQLFGMIRLSKEVLDQKHKWRPCIGFIWRLNCSEVAILDQVSNLLIIRYPTFQFLNTQARKCFAGVLKAVTHLIQSINKLFT